MTVLSVAVALVGILCLLDLVLTLGVIRRLRDHTARLTALQSAPGETAIAEPGELVAPFTASTVDGTVMSSDDLAGANLVAFFSPDCPACEQELAPFVEYTRTFPGGPERTLIVITSETGGAKYHSALSGLGRIVTEPELTGPVQKAFKTRGYPAFVVVVDGSVMQASHTVADLPQHQPA
ncbi:hypothetical protein [Amycolatopsis orientalis]|uniref:hypothetical protein n=1 Tax=Amycolatopsis orientalis TaxID=31958 RepID=UPI0003FD1970|nr:hypothetical protein [Amycolatopsis orientalis]